MPVQTALNQCPRAILPGLGFSRPSPFGIFVLPLPSTLLIRGLLALLLMLPRPGAAQSGPGRQFLKPFGAAEGLPQTFIYALHQDRAGYLWLGTAEGLVRYDGTAFVLFTTRQGLADNFVTRLGEDAAGRLWADHPQGRRSGWQGQRFGPAPLPAGPAAAPDTAALRRLRQRYQAQLPAHTELSCFLADREGNLWLGTAGQGLWRVSDQHITFFPDADGRLWATVNAGPNALRRAAAALRLPAPVTAAIRTPAALWVGTATDGVYRQPAAAAGPAQHFTTANGLLHNAIYALLADAAGRVWVATHGTGLAVWEQGRFRHFRLGRGGLNATALATDPAGRVWIGTEGAGLYGYANGRFRQYTTAQGLPSNYCYALAPFRVPTRPAARPAADYLLIVHQNQLSALQPATGRVAALSAPDNPLVRGCLPQLAPDSARGLLWVRTRTGVLRVDPRQWPAAPAVPTAVLTGADVDDARRPVAQLGQLAATRHRLAFRFRGISLARAGAVQYQYRLRGYQEAWSTPSAVAEAQFPRLDAGSYVFEARARLGERGAWSGPARAAFGIATPFWRTGWFGALALLMAGAAGYLLMRAREATLRRQQRQLETTVRERTAELRQRNADIEHMNAELVVARDAAEASRKAKAQFLANMSHEIRTPMNAVIGLTHLLRQTRTTPEQLEYLQAVQSSSQNLLVIINDILDSSKMEAGRLTLEQAPFHLPELLRRVQRMFQFTTESKGLYFHLDIAPTVPEAVLGDSVRLNQVLVNLVGNALKFTARGGVTVRVSAAEGGPDGATLVRFAVVDTGIGIAADKLEAIFEDFSQANTSTTREFGGTGLGLSIARSLVALHQGRLWVESELGRGSEFIFEIPYHAADAALMRPETTGPLTRFEPALRVLVAEDNDLNQLVARKTLEAWNVTVTVAANGRLAVEAARQQPFDAVLMDVQMPEMDGYEATRQLRTHFPDPRRLPIIGLTASALPEDRALALEAGMNDTLAKPFDPAVLYARLAHYTGRTALTQPAPQSAAVPPQPVVEAPFRPDWTVLEELAGGNEAFITQIITTFLDQAHALHEALQAAAHAADTTALAQTAHKLKGQVAYFGVPQLHAHLGQLEQFREKKPLPPDLPEQIATTGSLLRQLCAVLQARLTP